MHAQALFRTAAAMMAMMDMTTARPSPKAGGFPAGFGPRPAMHATNSTDMRAGVTAASTFYSSNWAGIIQSAASGESFTEAIGTFNLPTCGQGASGSGPWYNAYWVGIDGYTNGNALLQAGVICEYDSSGTRTYTPWVEYFPQGLITMGGFSMSEGDEVTVEIKVTSPTSGTLAVSDANSGQSTTTTLYAPAATNTLTGSSAEWILEDFSSGGGLVPFASFTPNDWSASTAQYASGGGVSADDTSPAGYTPTILENSSGQQITSNSADGGDADFVIQYTG